VRVRAPGSECEPFAQNGRVSELPPLGRLLVVVGLVVAGLGLLLSLGGKVPGLGRLPGDIVIERGGFRLCLPLATSLLLSLILTGVVWLLRR
jgi:hypothetical protein